MERSRLWIVSALADICVADPDLVSGTMLPAGDTGPGRVRESSVYVLPVQEDY